MNPQGLSSLRGTHMDPEAECFTSESKALRALRSRRGWNRSQTQLVQPHFWVRNLPFLYWDFSEFPIKLSILIG